MAVRIIITGDRNWRCEALAERIVVRLIDRYGRSVTIVHGAASGVDQSFARAATFANITQEPHPADWRKHGKAAGPKRNGEMVKAGATLCIAVHRDINASKGTKDCVRQCLAAGIPVWLIDGEDAEPVRVREA
jgi:hypothetical protein